MLFFVGAEEDQLQPAFDLRQSLTASERESALAGQFDTALEQHAARPVHVAADGRLAVMNDRFSEMMGLTDDLVQRGASAPEIIGACVGAGTLSAASGEIIV